MCTALVRNLIISGALNLSVISTTIFRERRGFIRRVNKDTSIFFFKIVHGKVRLHVRVDLHVPPGITTVRLGKTKRGTFCGVLLQTKLAGPQKRATSSHKAN